MSEKRVLVMDDDRIVLDTAVKMLTVLGYKTDTATEGQEAVNKYKQALEEGRRYDVVILDAIVPQGLGGMESLWMLKDLDPDAVVIVSSGYANDAAISEYDRVGFAGVLSKPYRVKDVKDVLQACTP